MKNLLVLLLLFCGMVQAQVFEPEENTYFATSETCFFQLMEALDSKNYQNIKKLETSQCVFLYDKNKFNFRMQSFELDNPNKPISLSIPSKFKIIGTPPKRLNSSVIWTRSAFARKL